MSWRTVVITKRCKLDYKMGSMIVRGEETYRIILDEISVLIIENTAVSLTTYLLEELSSRKIKVVFCDNKRNPSSELTSFYGCHDCSLKLKMQLEWNKNTKSSVWTEIVSDKIKKQMEFLFELDHEAEAAMLYSYLVEMQFNDITNREGHAAKVYFNSLFGKSFSRSDDCVTNAALNYGYSLVLSCINREVVANGYLTQLGLFHDNMYNPFNLSCDLMEPFRILVDRFVVERNYREFGTEQKHDCVDLLNTSVSIGGNKQYLVNAIRIYCHSVFDALNERDISLIKFYSV